jgi:hypothetical protein
MTASCPIASENVMETWDADQSMIVYLKSGLVTLNISIHTFGPWSLVGYMCYISQVKDLEGSLFLLSHCHQWFCLVWVTFVSLTRKLSPIS